MSVSAIDKDIGLNGRIRYELNPRGHFNINEDTGNISIAVELDREEENGDQHLLTIYAKDLGVNILSSTILLVVDVEDVNDENPTFDTDIVILEIPEIHDCLIPLTNVSAHDNDKPGTPNSLVSYKLHG